MKWTIDPLHSEVQFKVKHLVISTVTGHFEVYEGSVDAKDKSSFDDADVSFSLDVNSINTKQGDRDNHLKSADFFDTENFPNINFSEGKLVKKSEDTYDLVGNLTIKNATKAVNFRVTFGGTMVDFYGNTKAGFEINGSISRKDYGITWSATTEAGGLVVGDEVKLNLNIQLIKGAN